MADLFSAVKVVPDDRLAYYSAVNAPPWNLTIRGWGGMVTGVVPDGDGTYQVTVSAEPRFAHNSSLVMLSDDSEIYHVDRDNNATYVGFLDPKG